MTIRRETQLYRHPRAAAASFRVLLPRSFLSLSHTFRAGPVPLSPLQAPTRPEAFKEIMTDFDEKIMPGITHWESPNFFAYFKPHASFPSVLGELMCAGEEERANQSDAR